MAYLEYGGRFAINGTGDYSHPHSDQTDTLLTVQRLRWGPQITIDTTGARSDPADGVALFDNSDDRFTPYGGSLYFSREQLAAPHEFQLYRLDDGFICWEGMSQRIAVSGERRGRGAVAGFLLSGFQAENQSVGFEYKRPYNTPVIEWFEALAQAHGVAMDYGLSIMPPQELVGLIEWDLDPRLPVSLAMQETAIWSGQLVGETRRGLLATAHPNAQGRPVKVFDNQAVPIEDVHIEEAIGQVRNRIFAGGWEVLGDTVQRRGPAVPGGLRIVARTHGSIRLGWESVADADWYEVGIAEAGSTTPLLLERVTNEAAFTFNVLADGSALRPATNYLLAVRSGNDYSTSDWNRLVGATSAAVVPDPELPELPEDVPAVRVVRDLNGVVDIEWDAAKNATRYEYRARGATHQVGSRYTTELKGQLSLRLDTLYDIEVRGRSDTGGTSPNWTSAVYRTTDMGLAATRIGEPANVDLEVNGSGFLSLSWGSAQNATGYAVQLDSGDEIELGAAARSHDFTTAAAVGTTYTGRVKATNPELDPPESDWVEDTLTTAAATPTAETRLPPPAPAFTTRTFTRLVATWAAVPNATSYLLEWRRGVTGDWVMETLTALTFEIPSPSPGVTYYVRIRAAATGYTTSHYGTANASVVPRPAVTVVSPNAPVINSTPGEVTARIGWTVATSATRPVDWCEVRVLEGTTVRYRSPRLAGSRRSATATGLKPSTTYTVEVRVGNEAGSIVRTALMTTLAARTSAPTDAPAVSVSSGVIAGVGGHRVVWSWTSVARAETYDTRLDTGNVIDGRTHWREGTWVSRGADRSYTLPFPALFGRTYRLAVRGRGSIAPYTGPSDAEAITIPTPTRLAAPTPTIVQTGRTSITVQTSQVSGATAYQARRSIEFSTGDGGPIWTGWVNFNTALRSRHVFTGLSPGQTYQIQIRAITADRNRDSEPAQTSVRTNSRVLAVPTNLRIVRFEASALTLSWVIADAPSGFQVSVDGVTVAGVTLSRTARQYRFTGLTANAQVSLGVRPVGGRWAYRTARTLAGGGL